MSLLAFVDAVIVFMVAETAALVLWHRLKGRGLPLDQLLPMMAAGGFILLALRFALAGASAWVVVACLAGSGVAHALDVRRRWPLKPTRT
jgi:hypothetical protein